MSEEKNVSTKTRDMVLIAVMTAVTCVLGPLSLNIPVSPVPISLGILAIYFDVYVLGWKKGTISVLLYILLGLVGIPVFAGFTAGPQKLLGATGGYIVGYIFLSLIFGFMMEYFNKIYFDITGMLLGVAVCYAFGTAWLGHIAHMSFGAALAAGVIPYIPADLIKMAIALIAGPVIRKRLKKANLI